MKKYKVKGKVWLYPGHSTWHFFTIPPEIFIDIRKKFKDLQHGWGSIPTEVKCGKTIWKTSLFPNVKDGVYYLILKKSVRKAEGIQDGDSIDIVLTLGTIMKNTK